MSPRPAALLAIAAAALAGCPIPQPLPEYPEGQSVPPPRIVVTSVALPDVVVRVPTGCMTKPTYELGAELVADPTNTIDVVEARWFVNYEPDNQQRRAPVSTSPVPPHPDPLVFSRVVPPWTITPYDFPPIEGTAGSGESQGALHVVELVVSNGFLPIDAPSDLPNRSAEPGFETQIWRWVFVNVAPSGALPCPDTGT